MSSWTAKKKDRRSGLLDASTSYRLAAGGGQATGRTIFIGDRGHAGQEEVECTRDTVERKTWHCVCTIWDGKCEYGTSCARARDGEYEGGSCDCMTEQEQKDAEAAAVAAGSSDAARPDTAGAGSRGGRA